MPIAAIALVFNLTGPRSRTGGGPIFIGITMSYQYYPTGAHTAARMWDKFKRPVKHLCDPSAGKGHLIRYAQEGFKELSDEQLPWLANVPDEEVQYSRHHTVRLRDRARKKFDDLLEISAVEIDIQHHANLKELGAKVVGHDFLQVNSLATVGSIIMNPPFQDGVKHVLHAWDVVYDAEIVAIINAESIKNPFSRERIRLLELIEKFGSVEFLQSQFVNDVERSTEVEVALIHLDKVPPKYLDVETLLGGLRKGDNHMGEIDPAVCTALALPSNFINDTCYRFEQAVEAARTASEAAAVSNHMAAGLGLTLEEMQAKGVGSDFREASGSIRKSANDEFRKHYADLKKRAWAQIIRSSLLTDKLSNQARRKIEASSQSIYDLEFSIANVHGFLAGVIASMGDIYQDMVCDLFDTIIERSSDNVVFYRSWKSNQKHRVGVRIRKTRFIIPRFRVSSFGGSLEYESQQFLSDIDKIFGYLHGVSGAYDGLVNGFQQNHVLGGKRIPTKYFDFRFFQGTGTIHFFPKSEAVVEKINKFVGKLRQWIPGNMEEANQDFQKQYDKGESFTKEYMNLYKKSARNSYGWDRPALKVLQEFKGKEADGSELDRMEAAINSVHESMGLQCGPALSGPSGANVKTLAKRAAGQEQMLLLAA